MSWQPAFGQMKSAELADILLIIRNSAMLENINLKKKLSREKYKELLPGFQTRLYDLEKACWDNGIPSIVVLEGWDASGKGTTISALTQRLHTRGFKLYPI